MQGRAWVRGEHLLGDGQPRQRPRGDEVVGQLHRGHRTTLLNSTYKDVGFGLRKGTFLGHRGAQVWTGHFGYRKC